MKKHPSPLKAIRKHCLDCCLGQSIEVKLCGATGCPVHPLRHGKKVEAVNVLKTIRAKCAECSGDEQAKNCTVEDCNLWPFRTGHNPNRKGLGGNTEALNAWKAKHTAGIASAEKRKADANPGSSALKSTVSPHISTLNAHVVEVSR